MVLRVLSTLQSDENVVQTLIESSPFQPGQRATWNFACSWYDHTLDLGRGPFLLTCHACVLLHSMLNLSSEVTRAPILEEQGGEIRHDRYMQTWLTDFQSKDPPFPLHDPVCCQNQRQSAYLASQHYLKPLRQLDLGRMPFLPAGHHGPHSMLENTVLTWLILAMLCIVAVSRSDSIYTTINMSDITGSWRETNGTRALPQPHTSSTRSSSLPDHTQSAGPEMAIRFRWPWKLEACTVVLLRFVAQPKGQVQGLIE